MKICTSRASKRERCRGAILGLVLVIVGAVAFIGWSVVNLGGHDAIETSTNLSQVQAFWNAEAGLEEIKSIAQKVRLPFADIGGGGGLYDAAALGGTTSRGTYSVDIIDDPAWPSGGSRIKRYIVTSTGTSNGGDSKSVSVRAEIQTFASYMHSSNSEEQSGGGNIFFGTGDLLDGDVYVNDEINIYGTPQILGLTHSSAGSVNYQAAGSSATFVGGLVLNATPLDFLGSSVDHIDSIKAEAQSGGIALTTSGNYEIEFFGDGTVTYRQDLGGGSFGPTTTNDLASINGAIYVNGDAIVKGIVDGQVTLGVEDAIQIHESGIVYETAQSPNPWDAGFDPSTVDDALGLVARNMVQVLGSSDVNIHAAILVTQGDDGFTTANKYTHIGTPYLNLYGSLGQWRRGVVGTISGKGFLKNYKYDLNFTDSPPPWFPYSAYVITAWTRL
ncbi:MAG: hypothetical protein O2923_04490 [Verrucomicrobia bacterium]|nr:hypothetical protein [Verrucomicrobiota bacterium]MDA1086608.1 hypothetical protein [Verrucomicrobiota bacterium]